MYARHLVWPPIQATVMQLAITICFVFRREGRRGGPGSSPSRPEAETPGLGPLWAAAGGVLWAGSSHDAGPGGGMCGLKGSSGG